MNKQVMVTTTIQSPTPATRKLIEHDEWDFIIAGDLGTPHDAYRELEKEHTNVLYLHPDDQVLLHERLSNLIGWKCIQRRNMAFYAAYKCKDYQIVGTFDDDNIFDAWDGTTLVGTEQYINSYTSDSPHVFDPFRALGVPYHHRGFPLTLTWQSNHSSIKKSMTHIIVDVEAPIPEGDPDVDAVTRIINRPYLQLAGDQRAFFPFTSDKLVPFNSQCTFLRADLLPYYMMLPWVGRYDDIFGAYLLQKIERVNVVFNAPIATQERNEHDLTQDLRYEMYGYCNAEKFVSASTDMDALHLLPQETQTAFMTYTQAMVGLR